MQGALGTDEQSVVNHYDATSQLSTALSIPGSQQRGVIWKSEVTPHIGKIGHYSSCIPSTTKILRRLAHVFVCSSWTCPLINTCIVANCVCLALRNPLARECVFLSVGGLNSALGSADCAFVTVFAGEVRTES